MRDYYKNYKGYTYRVWQSPEHTGGPLWQYRIVMQPDDRPYYGDEQTGGTWAAPGKQAADTAAKALIDKI
jgi:hypothetical protein